MTNLIKIREDLDKIKKDIETLRKCDECRRGPCCGKLFKSREGFIFPNSLYVVDGNIYLKRCGVLSKNRISEAQVKIMRKSGYEIENLDIDLIVEDEVKNGDIFIKKFGDDYEEVSNWARELFTE